VHHVAAARPDPIRRHTALLGALVLGCALSCANAGNARAQAEPPPPSPGIASEEIVVTAERSGAVSTIKSQVGASSYTFGSQAIDALPGGADSSLSQVLLQAPGVNQDSAENSELHIRNEHANVQYRINGILLPEGVSFFGQGFSTRLADSVELITGTLPAQYGLRTAGIVDIETKSGSFAPGGSVGIYGGSYDTIQPSAEYGGSAGGYNFYVATICRTAAASSRRRPITTPSTTTRSKATPSSMSTSRSIPRRGSTLWPALSTEYSRSQTIPGSRPISPSTATALMIPHS
jgi:hypothetical protein